MDALPATDALAVHHSLLAIDTHIDIPWPTGPDPFEDGRRKVDLPKMKRGGITAGCFAAYVPQAVRTPASETAAFERAAAMLLAIRAMGRTEGGLEVRLATSADAIEAAKRDGVLAVVPAVENGFAMGTDLGRLARFAELGARYMTMTHTGHNALADSSNPRSDLGDREIEHDGLSALGRSAVVEMNRLGMLVDVAHVSRAAMLQLAACSRTPVVSTHSCIRALCDNPRNLDDHQLDALRDVGGVVQVTAVSAFLKPNAKPDAVTVADYADHIDYAVRRIGIAHVGISSDFDGGGWFTGWKDVSESPNITAELMRRGYDRGALALLWGGNFLRCLRAAEALAA
ncbi:MAG TPA: dipeptidase [Acetobacteraceae bacterium]|jgi:membrane dipeptidase|nr:dipeptidase [Acetobacteraceae bacterium]